MYYAIPINHDENQKSGYGLGRFGSVRNHWYNFKIKNINNLGVAVDRPEEEIVPNNLPKHEGLGVEMTVLPWHTISTDVDISGQRPPLSSDEIDLDLKLLLDDWNYQGKNEELE